MKHNLIQFASKDDAKPEANLAEFIRMCRDEVTWLSDHPDFDWGGFRWPGACWSKISARRKRIFDHSEALDPDFIDFAKAYYRYTASHSTSKLPWTKPALRCLEAGLLQVTGSGSLHGLTSHVLDETTNVIRQYTDSTDYRYKLGRVLLDIARFVDRKRLVPADLSHWRQPFSTDHQIYRTGLAAHLVANRKMPSQAGLEAIAELFSNDPDDAQTRFLTAVWALLMSAPWRIGELLHLHVDAEYEGLDDKGVPTYGFRYYGAKGFQHDIKIVPKCMEPVAREAFGRLREMTQSARDLASHLEAALDIPYRYLGGPNAGLDQPLSLEQKAAHLRCPIPKGVNAKYARKWRFASIRAHWKTMKGHLPASFPEYSRTTGLRWSQALFCLYPHSLSEHKSTNYYGLWTPTKMTIQELLGTRTPVANSWRKQRSIFVKWGYQEPGGSRIKLTTHQARHFLCTLAERGGMAQDALARWAARTMPKGNRVYNHMSEDEKVERSRSLQNQSSLHRYFLDTHEHLQGNMPVEETDVHAKESGPVHKTLYGYCGLDWTMSPCMKYRDCLNCTEHLCIKGDADSLVRIRSHVNDTQQEYNKALDAIRLGAAGADRWFQYQAWSLARSRELLRLLESDEVEDGAILKLEGPGAHSHVGRALDQRLGRDPDSLLPTGFKVLVEAPRHG